MLVPTGSVWKYRDNASAQRATYSHGNNRLEIIWTLVTAVIFISLAIMGQRVWASLQINKAPPGSYQIKVVAQQFSWNFHYAGKDNVFGKTDPNLIDDSALNYVGLDGTDPNAKDDSVVSTLVIPVAFDKPIMKLSWAGTPMYSNFVASNSIPGFPRSCCRKSPPMK